MCMQGQTVRSSNSGLPYLDIQYEGGFTIKSRGERAARITRYFSQPRLLSANGTDEVATIVNRDRYRHTTSFTDHDNASNFKRDDDSQTTYGIRRLSGWERGRRGQKRACSASEALVGSQIAEVIEHEGRETGIDGVGEGGRSSLPLHTAAKSELGGRRRGATFLALTGHEAPPILHSATAGRPGPLQLGVLARTLHRVLQYQCLLLLRRNPPPPNTRNGPILMTHRLPIEGKGEVEAPHTGQNNPTHAPRALAAPHAPATPPHPAPLALLFPYPPGPL
ncbi:hypothetical protein C8R43DRAFT_1195293 [Mycena crocata]|nr:hypothetical protein C8R43DRAFT_1195293 [Mycena crocata]